MSTKSTVAHDDIAVDSANALTGEEPLDSFSGPDLISDDDIDYADIARRTQPDQPGGQIVFSSRDYASHEEAMTAFEALLKQDLGGFDDEGTCDL